MVQFSTAFQIDFVGHPFIFFLFSSGLSQLWLGKSQGYTPNRLSIHTYSHFRMNQTPSVSLGGRKRPKDKLHTERPHTDEQRTFF